MKQISFFSPPQVELKIVHLSKSLVLKILLSEWLLKIFGFFALNVGL